MQSSTKKTAAADPGQHALRSGGGAQTTGDAQSRQLARLQKRMGNSEASAGVSSSATTRDALLQFICQRLQQMQGIQDKEFKAFLTEREWYREVAKGTPGYTVPEPKRWHESAREFKEAALALSHGNVQRGCQLLDRAVAAEEAAYKALPKMVRDTLEDDEKELSAVPTAKGPASGMSLAPACNPPPGLVYADQILSQSAVYTGLEPIYPWEEHNWWDEEEEEENPDDPKKKGKQGAKAGEKPAEKPAAETSVEADLERPAPEQELPALQKDRAKKGDHGHR